MQFNIIPCRTRPGSEDQDYMSLMLTAWSVKVKLKFVNLIQWFELALGFASQTLITKSQV